MPPPVAVACVKKNNESKKKNQQKPFGGHELWDVLKEKKQKHIDSLVHNE